VDKIIKWLEELVDYEILESEHDLQGTHFRIKRTSMRRAIYDAMLFKTRQQIHTKLINMFHLYDSDPAAQRFILFNAEKASLYDEVFTFFWNDGITCHMKKDYDHGTFSFEQALSLINDKTSDVALALQNVKLKLKKIPQYINNVADMKVEVKKRLALHYIWVGKFTDANDLVEDVLKYISLNDIDEKKGNNVDNYNVDKSHEQNCFGCFGKVKRNKKVDNKKATSNSKIKGTKERQILSWHDVLQALQALTNVDRDGIRHSDIHKQYPTNNLSYGKAFDSANQALSRRAEIVKMIESMEKW
jgi:hypothetical protein